MLDLDPTALVERLAQLRAEDPPTADALEGLLGQQTGIDRDGYLQTAAQLPAEAVPGQTIGAYEIERVDGRKPTERDRPLLAVMPSFS